jgi:hypothetical protein
MLDRRIFDDLPASGWLTYEEAEVLWNAAMAEVGPILEVGCYFGRSTVLLAQVGRPLYCVDPFTDGFDDTYSGAHILAAFRKNLADRGLVVQLFQQRIEEWNFLPVGFAYLDGDHTYQGTKDQITVAMLCGARRFCLHDYAHAGGGVAIKRAVQDSRLVVDEFVGRLVLVHV